NGVVGIELVRLEWGAVTARGSSATATTNETWRGTFDDGSTDVSQAKNVYTLVLLGGGWKIAADQHPGQDGAAPTPTPRPNPAPAPPSPPQAPAPERPMPGAPSANSSRNWSGYAATGG